MTLKELRIDRGLTQSKAAQMLGLSLRSYQSYENDDRKRDTIQYRYYLQELDEQTRIDEVHGVLNVEKIRDICRGVFSNASVQYCYLFGSYSRGEATDTSDVDLLISTSISGLRYYELVETLRDKLKKKIDLLDIKQLASNEKLIDAILRDGIKIYEKE